MAEVAVIRAFMLGKLHDVGHKLYPLWPIPE